MQADRVAATATVRPRRGRIAAALASLSVTVVSVLGGVGVLPVTAATADTSTKDAVESEAAGAPRPAGAGAGEQAGFGADGRIGAEAGASDGASDGAGGVAAERGAMALSGADTATAPAEGTSGDTSSSSGTAPAVPSDSGTGRRVVFDMSDQRVWLVDEADGSDVVVRTYLVSGSVTDNLEPGTYAVYSRSLDAVGIDDSGTMRYMVRFASGDNAAIGFHDIPVDDGEPVQTRAELGTPQSHGCIRQWRTDAQALWRFAPVDTPVVVVA